MIFLRVKWNEVAQSCLTLCNPMDYSLYDLLCDLPILCTNHYHMVVFSRYVVSNSCNPMDWSLLGSSVHEDSPGKNTRVGCHALFQGIFPTQGSHPCLLHCRQILHRWATARPSIEQNLELKGCFNLCYCNMIAKFRNLSLGRLYMILSV